MLICGAGAIIMGAAGVSITLGAATVRWEGSSEEHMGETNCRHPEVWDGCKGFWELGEQNCIKLSPDYDSGRCFSLHASHSLF